MSQRILHIETVNAMVPLIQRISDDLEGAFDTAASDLRRSRTGVTSRAAVESLDRCQRLVEELEKLGGTLCSYQPLCVDFISEVDGEIGYVRWQTGDPEATRFHGALNGCDRSLRSA